mgnify:CR=1 FL=1|tara:strand:- start:46287 stop:46997 length:711 start_codon:yes stop_codon:yes gene_type:complete
MRIIDPNEFRSCKSSDTIYILGSGSSINAISPSQWDAIGSADSIAFNWFCKHDSFEPRFYIVREQANIPKRISRDETPEILFKRLNRYSECCFIVHDVSNHSPHAYPYNANLDRIEGKGVVVHDRQKGSFEDDIFKQGVYHGAITLNNVLHIVQYLGYKKVVFAGIDLNNSKYFWLDDSPRHTIVKKGIKVLDRHPVSKKTIEAVRKFDERNPSIKVVSASKSSLLNKVIPYEQIR